MTALLASPWFERSLAGAGLACALLLLTAGRGAPSGHSEHVVFSVTAPPSDLDDSACSSDTAFAGRRCVFDARGRSVDVERPLRPYVSVDQELLLVSGVFEAPKVLERLARSRDEGSERVTLRCRGTMPTRAARVRVRLRPDDAFAERRDVPVVIVRRCSVRP